MKVENTVTNWKKFFLNLTLNEVQVDEFWGFVHKKEYNLADEEKLLEESGDTWTYTAIMPENKLIFAHLSGKRTYSNTRKFISMVRKRSDGTIPYFSSDGYEGYKESILSVYGEIQNNKTVPPEDLCYAQVNKKIERNRCISVDKKLIFGDQNLLNKCINKSWVSNKINTSFIERSNLAVRQHNKRVERKSQGFSKLKYYFEKQMSLSIAYYNFCLPNSSLKYYLKDKIIYNTPAMEAGLTDHIWRMEELLTYPIN